MPDLSPLPRLAPAPAVAVDPARFLDARRAGHRRRTQRGAAAMAGVMAVAGVAAFAPSSGSQAGVAPTSGGGVARPAEVREADVVAPAATRPDTGAAPAGRAPRPVQPRPEGGAPVAAPRGAAPTPVPSLPTPTRPPKPVVVEAYSTLTVVADDGTPCQTLTNDAGDPRPWCVRSHSADPASGATSDAHFEICRDASTTGTLHWEDGANVTVRLTQGSSELWVRDTTAAGVPQHQSVGPDECARWTVTWRAADGNGTALAAGTYRLGWRTYGGADHDVLTEDGPLLDRAFSGGHELDVT